MSAVLVLALGHTGIFVRSKLSTLVLSRGRGALNFSGDSVMATDGDRLFQCGVGGFIVMHFRCYKYYRFGIHVYWPPRNGCQPCIV